MNAAAKDLTAREQHGNRTGRLPEWAIQPVHVLGTTWYDRGPRYWLRRVALSFAYLFFTLVCSGLPAGFLWSVWSDRTSPLGFQVAASVAVAVVILGSAAWTHRSLRRGEEGLSRGHSRRGRLALGARAGSLGALAGGTLLGAAGLLLCALIGFGGMVVVFAWSLRREFFGEHQARRRTRPFAEAYLSGRVRVRGSRRPHRRRGAKT